MPAPLCDNGRGMTRRVASFLILIAMAIGGGYAVASPRKLNAPAFFQSVESEKADRSEVRWSEPDRRGRSEPQAAAPVHQTPHVRSPHPAPRYQRPPPSR